MTCKFFLTLSAFVLFSTSLFSQNGLNNYDKFWKKADSLIQKKGLIQSAQEEVNKIYTLAKKEKNNAQVLKALIYRLSLNRQVNSDIINNIKELDREILVSTELAKSILRSIEAENYWNYFQQHRNQLYDRTETNNFKKEDIATWGISDFQKKISELYLASIGQEKLLQQTKLESFDAIITKGNVRYLRPTLYDLLTHRALDYFKNDEIDINRPTYAFELNDSAAFAPRNIFVSHHFINSDSLSLHYKALLLFQELLQFHSGDTKPDAALDVDIDRIIFARQYATLENKEELYAKALKHITDEYDGNTIAAQAWFLQAEQFANKARQYNPLSDTSNRFAYIEAKKICERILQQADSSEGKTNCANLLTQITEKELSTQTEKVNVPGQPFRTMLNYRNFTQINWRIVLIDKRAKENLGTEKWQDEYWKKLTNLPAVKSYSQSLPDTKDYQKHAVEIKTDALEPGEYVLLASINKDFSLEKNYLSSQEFYVSNISYIRNSNDYFVLNRETGQPLQATEVQVWYRYYDAKQNKYVQRKGEQFNTDKNGFFHISPSKTPNTNQVDLEFKRDNDHLFMTEERTYDYGNIYNKNTQNDRAHYESDNLQTFFFTDRSIYRPGQTVYFKGITVTKDFESRQYKIVPQFKTKLILYNANEERIDSVSLVTNEFGSYHGSFKLPEGQLNGEFKIEDDSTESEQSFSVEEYKRPKFNVSYDTIKGSYRVNDNIHVTGIAKAYSGNSISDAIVKYRVVRYARYPRPLYYKIGWHPDRQQEISHGEIKTDKDGKFLIDFVATPDKTFSKESDPLFDYKVIADVTDINGETHSAETSVHVSYKSINLSIIGPDENNLPTDSLKFLYVRTENQSGQFEKTKINISIFQLAAPNRLIRERFWQQPDQFVMTKEEYLNYFPFDEYSDETRKESWDRIGKIVELADSTDQNKKINIKGPGFKTGWYLIEVTAKDKYGEEVKDSKYIQLVDSKTGFPASPSYNWITESSQVIEPGNTATVNIGSSAKDLFVISPELANPERSRRTSANEVEQTGSPERSRRTDPNEVQQTDSPERSRRTDTNEVQQTDNPERSRRTDPSEVEGTYKFLTLNNERKSLSIPITEESRGGIGISFAFVKNNRFFVSNNSVLVPWTNKQLQISYETYRDKTLPGSEEKWKIKITGSKKDKVAAEVLASMYDASLDQFKPHTWNYPDIYSLNTSTASWTARNNFSYLSSEQKNGFENIYASYVKNYDRIIQPEEFRRVFMRGLASMKQSAVPQAAAGKAPGLIVANYDSAGEMYVIGEKMKKVPKTDIQSNSPETPALQIRKNFSETAFFLPDLKTDSSGNIEFSFTMPEALTQWKWMTFAYTKNLSMAYGEKSIITQKQLMVQPNAPRFLREGDKLELSTKIVNMTDSSANGSVILQLIDPTTNQSVDTKFSSNKSQQNFSVGPKESISINFPIDIPYNYNQPLTYRIVATAGKISDGEEATLPVLNNRILVTESMPLNMNSTGTKKFRFEKLLQSGESKTLSNQSLTVEFTSNPAWYAVQALPYLMEFPYECSEQTFNRFYANALASMIANSSPRIKEIFERWKTADTAALLSNLQKNEELKSVLLQETPWVLAAKNEATQKKNIALLFDMIRMNQALGTAFSKLQNMQLENGGFSWFKDGPDDRYITQYILTGIGHLKKMNALPKAFAEKMDAVVASAIVYLDKKIKSDYDELQKRLRKNPKLTELSTIQIQYLYMRSFFSDYAIPGDIFSAMNYYRKQAQLSWLQQSRYMQGMIALSLYRTGDIKTANDILASLRQNAITNEEMGMYWKDIRYGYYWYESPIETQSLLIEAFNEIKKDDKITASLKTWLLKQKQTQNWSTTKATADACYAMLSQGTNLLAENNSVTIELGDKIIDSKKEATEAGTGYFKKIIPGDSVSPVFGNVSVSLFASGKPSATDGGRVAAWGAIYWQYFENLDKITSSSNTKMPLTLSKKVFIERNTDRGPVLEPVSDNATLKIGDKIKVRIELVVDRDMEYVHMKDMRASASEPVNVISQYKWQGALGYYETTKDASTNFFFSWLPKGTHVFEYPLFVTSAGNFSNGITTIQCMYAPEFSAHSEGIRIDVR